ncbi:hypothetical protein BX666DRAFT_1894221 [Dichotomocladium elegans]|nr:hypothetical protein BX666DRAFT_1894221 [Dichotomocladium elegans]
MHPLLQLAVRRNPSTLVFGLANLLLLYLALVRLLRYRKIRRLCRKYPDPTLALRDAKVAEEVFDVTFRNEFPFLGRLSLELALFKTYSVPSISKILAATGEFKKNTNKRFEDTSLILMEMTDVYPHIKDHIRQCPAMNPVDIEKTQRERAHHVLLRLNEIHAKYPILNGDYLYTLSLFIIEPIRWINKYGYRKLEPLEENAIFRIWYDIGKKMHIEDIPETLEDMKEFHKRYALDHVRYSPDNWKVGEPTVQQLSSLYPKFTHAFIYKLVPAILNPADVAGFGLDPPSERMANNVDRAFRLTQWVVRHMMLPCIFPRVRTPTLPDKKTGLYKTTFDVFEPVYPNGYCIYALGPDKALPAQCPLGHTHREK